jgi:hypothetical protein
MNLLFFVPLGIFARNLFGRRLSGTLIIAFLVSLFIETAQLTGGFGFYPCSYRLFDVDDLLLNTLGASLGFGLARYLPDFSRPKKPDKINTNPKLIHRSVAFVADYATMEIVALLAVLPVGLAGGDWQEWHWLSRLICFVALQFIVPLCCKGQTIFGRLTGISLDDKERSPFRRCLYYMARAALIGVVVLWRDWWTIAIILAIWLYWLIFHKMPYTLVDKLGR